MFDSDEKKANQVSPVVGKPRVLSHFFPNVKPHPIPQLPLLDELVSIAKSKNITFEKTLLVGVQHILETTATLFESLIRLGAKPERMFFSGKCYSTSSGVAASVKNLGIQLMPDYFPTVPGGYQEACRTGLRDMWKRAEEYLKSQNDVDTLLIIDDGGRCLEEMPSHLRFKYKVAGIEQTRGGLYSPTLKALPFPLVEPATSAAKRHLESPFIAQAIIKRLHDLLSTKKLSEETIFGVVGNGAIGDAVVSYLLDKGFNTIAYDKDESAFQQSETKEHFYRCEIVDSLMENADCIFLCTGLDVTEKYDFLQLARRKKMIISATSEDKEVLTLLKGFAGMGVKLSSPFENICYKTEHGAELDILNGGLPFNFDRQPGNVPVSDIELTQGLMLISCMQGLSSATKPTNSKLTYEKRYMLSPTLQRFAVNFWQTRNAKQRYPVELLNESFMSTEWIITQSGEGVCHKETEVLFSDIEPKLSVQDMPKQRLSNSHQ